MHECKNVWTICPRPTRPRVNSQCFSVLFNPSALSKLHVDADRREREEERTIQYQSQRVEIIREIGRGLKKDWFQVLPFARSDLHANLPKPGFVPTRTIILPHVRIVPSEISKGEKLPF